MTILVLNEGVFSFDYNEWLPDETKTRPLEGFKKENNLIGKYPKNVSTLSSIGMLLHPTLDKEVAKRVTIQGHPIGFAQLI